MSKKSGRDLFSTCARLYAEYNFGYVTSNLADSVQRAKDLLRPILTEKAMAICNSGQFGSCNDMPGYVLCKVGNFEIFIPWFILDDFPNGSVLDELLSIAIKIKGAHFSNIGLSGSAMYFNALKCVSDIDYIEYEYDRVADPREIKYRVDIPLMTDDNGADYLEYITNTSFYGVVSVTNKFLVKEIAGYANGANPESSPFQEAPIVYTPHNLCDPIALGAYIHYLARSVFHFQDMGQPLKAAKRMLPLTRILELTDVADALLDAFEDENLQRALRVQQKIDLTGKIKGRDDRALDSFLELAKNDIVALREGAFGFDGLSPTEKGFIDELGAEVENILSAQHNHLLDLTNVG